MKISKNFTLKELKRTECRIPNDPDERALINIVAGTHKILQPCRDEFGLVRVTSAYRCPAVNQAIGGSKTSDHCAVGTSSAFDFEIASEEISNLQLAEWIRDNLEYKQLILEYYNPAEGPNSGWVHCSYDIAGGNRKEIKTAKVIKGKTKYLDGFVVD
jgi:hypothetical protein